MVELKKEADLNKSIEEIYFARPQCCLSDLYFSSKVIPLFVKFFIKTGLTPNHVTWLGFICNIFAGLCFGSGKYIYLVIGAVLIQLSLILDHVDGIIAIMKHLTSSYGEWLDYTTDAVGLSFVVFCAGFGTFYHSGDIIRLYVGLLGSMFVIFEIFAMQRALIVKPEPYASGIRKRVKQKIRIDIAQFLHGPCAHIIWLTVGALLNFMYFVFVFYFMLFHGIYFARIFVIYRKHLTDKS